MSMLRSAGCACVLILVGFGCHAAHHGTSAVCGNGIREVGETCDGSDLGGMECFSLDLGNGTLRCDDACEFDTSGCVAATVCGNGVREAGEACDGADLGGETCASLGFVSGALGCLGTCQLDLGGCVAATYCGDGACNAGETSATCPWDCGGGSSCWALNTCYDCCEDTDECLDACDRAASQSAVDQMAAIDRCTQASCSQECYYGTEQDCVTCQLTYCYPQWSECDWAPQGEAGCWSLLGCLDACPLLPDSGSGDANTCPTDAGIGCMEGCYAQVNQAAQDKFLALDDCASNLCATECGAGYLDGACQACLSTSCRDQAIACGGGVGAPCTHPDDCGGITDVTPTCLTDVGGFVNLPGGYCSASCAGITPDPCVSAGGVCVSIQGMVTYCLRPCTTNEECRMDEGYVCGNMYIPGYCVPPV